MPGRKKSSKGPKGTSKGRSPSKAGKASKGRRTGMGAMAKAAAVARKSAAAARKSAAAAQKLAQENPAAAAAVVGGTALAAVAAKKGMDRMKIASIESKNKAIQDRNAEIRKRRSATGIKQIWYEIVGYPEELKLLKELPMPEKPGPALPQLVSLDAVKEQAIKMLEKHTKKYKGKMSPDQISMALPILSKAGLPTPAIPPGVEDIKDIVKKFIAEQKAKLGMK